MPTLKDIEPYLKEVYEGRIREQLNNETVTLKRIERSKTGITSNTNGKYVTFPIHTRRNQGIGSRGEMEALPKPGAQGHAAAQLKLKYGYGGVQLTGQTISLSDTDSKAFAKAVDVEMNGLKNDLKKDMNRQIYGGSQGAISTVVSKSGQDLTVSDARLFQVGAIIDAVKPSDGTVHSTALVVDEIDVANNVVTVTGATTNAAAGDVLVRTGSFDREITGLSQIISDTGELYGIDPNDEPEWRAEVDENGGTPRALSEGLMTTMNDRIRTRGGKTTVIFQSLGTRRAYANLLMQLRGVVNQQEFTGGFKGLAFVTDGEQGEIPVISDPDAPLGTQYFVNEEDLTLYRDEEWHFLNRDGSMWKQVTDANGVYDAWYAHMTEYHELGCHRRGSHGVIRDIIEE